MEKDLDKTLLRKKRQRKTYTSCSKTVFQCSLHFPQVIFLSEKQNKWNCTTVSEVLVIYIYFLCWLLIAPKNCFRDVWVLHSRCQRLMSLKLEVQTGFTAGCNQEKGEEQAGGAKLGGFPTWLYQESFHGAPGLPCSPHCPSPEQCSESSLHWRKSLVGHY